MIEKLLKNISMSCERWDEGDVDDELMIWSENDEAAEEIEFQVENIGAMSKASVKPTSEKNEVFCEFHSFIVFSLLCGGVLQIDLWLERVTLISKKKPPKRLKILQNTFLKGFKLSGGGGGFHQQANLWWKIKIFNCYAFLMFLH